MAHVPAKNSLLGLPRELRNQIFKYTLPLNYLWSWGIVPIDDFRYRTKDDIGYLGCGCAYRHKSDPCPLSITRVNRQLNAEALDFMCSEPMYLSFQEGDFFGGWASEMTEAAESEQKYIFITDWKYFHVRKQVYIQVQPSDFPGFWQCLRSALTTLCDDELTHPIENIEVNLLDMKEGSWWGMNDEHIEDVYDPIMARLDDYAATLDIFEEVFRKAARCTIRLPYWAESQKGITTILENHHQALGAKIEFVPLGPRRASYRFIGVDKGAREGLAEVWEE